MKKILLFLTLFFAANIGYSQYTQKSFKPNFAYVLAALRAEFTATAKRWTFDSYVSSSSRIEKYYETKVDMQGGYNIKVTGTYQYKRLTKTYTGTFESIILTDPKDDTKYKAYTLKWEAE